MFYLSSDKPGPPSDLNVKDIFADHCTLSWAAPKDDGGAEISGNYVNFVRSVLSQLETCSKMISKLFFSVS